MITTENFKGKIADWIDFADFADLISGKSAKSADSSTSAIQKSAIQNQRFMITTEKFFDQQIILEDELVRIEPLEERHFELLLPTAMEPALWLFTVAKIDSPETFRKYFDTALEEKKISAPTPSPILIDKPINTLAAPASAILNSHIKKWRSAGPGSTLRFRVLALTNTANFYCSVLVLKHSDSTVLN